MPHTQTHTQRSGANLRLELKESVVFEGHVSILAMLINKQTTKLFKQIAELLLTCVEGLFKTQEVSVKWVIDKKYV
jgi:hypothetical protein